jgi:hypothetical protein
MTGEFIMGISHIQQNNYCGRRKEKYQKISKKSELLPGAKTCLLFFETNFAFHLLSGKPARQRLQEGKLVDQYWI